MEHETEEQKVKRITNHASVFQADVDHDWLYFEQEVEELEKIVEEMGDCLVRSVLGFVIVQIYLNKIKRGLDDV